MAYIKFKPLAAELKYTAIVGQEEIEKELIDLFNKNEKVFIVCKATRDLFIATNKRLIILDRKGVRGFRREIHSITYESISSYSLAINNFDTIITLVTNSGYKVSLSFYKPIPLSEMFNIYSYISDRILEK